MLLYLAAALVVCMTGYSSAQYYSNQPQRGYPAPLPQQQPPPQQQGQRNADAWKRWYYQNRQQQQQSSYSASRGRQPAPLSSPAANPQSSGYYSQNQAAGYAAPSSPQYQQPYYQQRAPAGYGQQQGYAQQPQPYNNYRPPPATPAPPTTPAELQSAFGKRPTTDVLNSLIDLVTSAVQSMPALARQTQLINRGRQIAAVRGQPANFRYASLPGSQVNTLLQQGHPDNKLLALLGNKSGSSVGIGMSPGLNSAVNLLSRFNHARTNPYSYPADMSSAYRRLPNHANLQYAYSKRRMFPGITRNSQSFGPRLTFVRTTPAPKLTPTTTPGVPVATEPLEVEGPTTTPLPRFKQAAAVNLFQAKMASRSGPAPGQQSASVSIRQPAILPGQQPARQPASQPWDYPPQPYQTFNVQPPPGFISIDAFRADIMSAIDILTKEIATIAAGNANTTTPSTISKERQIELIKSKKLAALPGGLSFLLGKFASKLPPKLSSASKLQSQVSQNSPGGFQTPAKKAQPPSEWSGVFDLSPRQLQEFKRGTWSRQWPSAPPTQPPQLQQQYMPLNTSSSHQVIHGGHMQASPQQQHQPPHDPMLQPQGQNPPPEQFPGPTTAGYPPQSNQSYMFEQQQPPPLDIQQQGPSNLPMQPHPLDGAGQQPWQQSQPPAFQHPMDFQGPQQTSHQQPPPHDFGPPPPAPQWREPPPQPSHQPPHFNSHSPQNQLAPQPQYIIHNSGPQNPPPQPPQPLDTPWQQPPGPQEYHQQQHQQQQQPMDPQWSQQHQPRDPQWSQQHQQHQPRDPQWSQQQQQQQPMDPQWSQQQQQPMDPQWSQQQQQQQPMDPQLSQQQQQQQQPTNPQWSQQQPQQQPPPVQDFPPPPNNPPPMFNSFEQQPQPRPGEYHHQPQQHQQRPPPLDITNLQPLNSRLEPPPPPPLQPPRQEFIPPLGSFDPPPLEQPPWTPPLDIGGMNSAHNPAPVLI